MSNDAKQRLYHQGVDLLSRFCKANRLIEPPVRSYLPADWRVSACAYYRPTSVHICPERCAHIGMGGPSWSYPGYVVDRTPYGVLQHELGHHADAWFDGLPNPRRYYSDYSARVRRETQEEPITSYCPNDAEWFAEMFRLLVTNPDLLRLLRPRTYERLKDDFSSVVDDSWDIVLGGAPVRTVAAAQVKIEKAARQRA